MTDLFGFGAGARLAFHGPLSGERADRLAADLAAGRAKLDRQRSIWLRGHRDVLGFAYLTLGVPRSKCT